MAIANPDWEKKEGAGKRPLQWRLLHGLDQILDLDRMGPKLGGQLVEIGIGQLLKAGLVDASDDLDAERFEFVGRLVLEVDGLGRLLVAHFIGSGLYPFFLLVGQALPKLVADPDQIVVGLV